ncbi:MAG: type IV toxin-antitoxin system AbiEi family antitoxin domain-containing protein [Actinomycetota bacterium]
MSPLLPKFAHPPPLGGVHRNLRRLSPGAAFITAMGPDVACSRLARSQQGLVTASQALQRGLSQRTVQRRVTSGAWEKLLPGVYRLPGAPA